ncbi:hypothetical protein BC939DRAFT_461522 [Gamsiella multidivaricata]|uniref:uncharacterized protein n=1 Tax=Gamsiella multidivaricata TaxID=101098 RepID=UPI00221E4F4D|nr:uncharacterized protein BC939DRAFT_461522 [Gamsiella multidivaricata]KAI7818943.1 hypothetical protein BC939DRAFT_461522 [Gamsiella multidivaricata]
MILAAFVSDPYDLYVKPCAVDNNSFSRPSAEDARTAIMRPTRAREETISTPEPPKTSEAFPPIPPTKKIRTARPPESPPEPRKAKSERNDSGSSTNKEKFQFIQPSIPDDFQRKLTEPRRRGRPRLLRMPVDTSALTSTQPILSQAQIP